MLEVYANRRVYPKIVLDNLMMLHIVLIVHYLIEGRLLGLRKRAQYSQGRVKEAAC